MFNDLDWFGIATDGPIVGSLEKGVFVKPGCKLAGKAACWTNIIRFCLMFLELGAWVCCTKQYIAVFICAIVFTHLYNLNISILFLSVCFEGQSPSQFAVGGIEHTHTHKHNTILWYRTTCLHHIMYHNMAYHTYIMPYDIGSRFMPYCSDYKRCILKTRIA